MSDHPSQPARSGSESVPPDPQKARRGWSGLQRTVLLGAALVLAFLVGMSGIQLWMPDDPLPDEVQAPVTGAGQLLDERVEPTEQEPLPDMTLAGFSEEGLPPEEAGAQPVQLADYRGEPLVVNFWATWCPPCVKEMPDLQEFWEAHGAQVALLGVNTQDAPSNAAAFVEELGITYDLAVDPAGELFSAVRGFGMPTTLFVDAGGTIVYRYTGPLDADELHSIAERHLEVALP